MPFLSKHQQGKFFIALVTLFILTGGMKVLHAQQTPPSNIVNIIYTSDVHFGIRRNAFRGDSGVISNSVNSAMVQQMNSVPAFVLAKDGGINGGNPVGPIDFMIQTGDISNRMEIPVQTASGSWGQFETSYMENLKLKDHNGKPTQILLVPGNHDISNAIGFIKPMKPLIDPTPMVNMYNLMLKPAIPLTNKTFNYTTDKINYSRNVKGIHLMFITLWPDSAERIWMQQDLDTVSAKTPVIIFTHDPPVPDASHFTNPVSPYNMSAENKFENLLTEHYKEGIKVAAGNKATDIEQRGFVKFLKAHPNIKAYFHGHSNWTEFYVYRGPDNDVNLNTIRVDSPMKGKFSSKYEELISFELITIDPLSQSLTVRECLWNTEPLNQAQKVVMGKMTTFSLKVN